MITAKDVAKAHKILRGVVVNTPLEYDHYLSEKYGAKIYLKKKTPNVFVLSKFVVLTLQFLTIKRRAGTWVVCASAGNHAQGLLILVMK